jgi:tetratricopeptide (TPR) repeat protein
MHYQAGRPGDVIEVLDPLASEPIDHPLGYVTATLLAEGYKDFGDSDRALRKLDEIAAGAYVPYQRHRALAEKGRLLAELGRYEESAAAYRLLAEDEGAADDLYRVRLGEVQALMASGSAAEPSEVSFSAPPLSTPDPSAASDGLEPDSVPIPADSAPSDSVPASSDDSP